MNSLDKSSNIILKQCVNLRKNESCLIITDKKLNPIGKNIYNNSLKITNSSKLVVIPIPKSNGTEPPKHVARLMLDYDVILMPTTMSLSHTKARKSAIKNGARGASMPGITEEMMERALNVDFYKIRKINKRTILEFKNKEKIRITTEEGTDILFDLGGRRWISDDGIYRKKGTFGNLPAGEIFIAPAEFKTNGIVKNAILGAGNGKMDKNVTIRIKDGFISDINGGVLTDKFRRMLKDRLYRNVAELGIGTNYKAKITGNTLEDEKVINTFHIAFGNNKHFGGRIDVPFHVDFVVRSPVIYADGKRVGFPKNH